MQFGDLSSSQFTAEYWRQQPYLVRGGAANLVDFALGKSRFMDLCDRLEEINPLLVQRLDDGTIFAQNLDAVHEGMRAISRQFEERFRYQRVWFDGAYAVDGGGLGSHYDQSDVFLIQLQGRKRWHLHSPDCIPESDLRLRMLGAANGSVPMPEGHLELTMEQGDCLYLPLFWIHDGVSLGESVAVSLTLNSTFPLRMLTKSLKAILSETPDWWRPMPATPCPVGDADRQVFDEEMERLFDRLITELSSEALRDRIKQAWRESYLTSGQATGPHTLP